MKKETFEVGQILYVVPTGKTSVMPVQVVEEIRKKTLKGEEISYIVKYGQNKTENIQKIDGEIFDSSEHVLNVLLERSSLAIEKLVKRAIEYSHKWYEDSFEGSRSNNNNNNDDNMEQELPRREERRDHPSQTQQQSAKVTLDDGTIANIKMPDVLQ